ncbi:MAG: hypothetical protein K8R41_03000 [Bacteroidales bacterium]|nr:hypothetical protein [Bacteroidales bacterium]
MSIIGIVLSIVLTFPFDSILKKENVKNNLEIKNRIKNLDKISDELEGLSKFVAEQKRSLEYQNSILNELKVENKKLEKVVDLKKENVETLFQIQEDIAQRRVWIDRLFGFFIGLTSSFVIALIFKLRDKKDVIKVPSLNDEIYVRKKIKIDR